MLRLITEFITYAMAGYGIFCLITYTLNHVRGKTVSNGDMRQVLLVRNVEGTVEGVIRGIQMEIALGGTVPDSELMVVDMGSSDGTMEILKRLKTEYAFMEAMEYDDRDKVFEAFWEK